MKQTTLFPVSHTCSDYTAKTQNFSEIIITDVSFEENSRNRRTKFPTVCGLDQKKDFQDSYEKMDQTHQADHRLK